MRKYFNEILERLSDWWNQIAYIKIYFYDNVSIKIPRKYVSIGFETENVKVITLKDIKKYEFNIKEIYPRLVLSNYQKWTVYLSKVGSYEDLGWFEPRSINIKNCLDLDYFKKLLYKQHIDYIVCYGRWYRGFIKIRKTKPYVYLDRFSKVIRVPKDNIELDIESFINFANKEQAVSLRNNNEFEIRWTKKAIEIFKENKEKYKTYKNLIPKERNKK